MESSLSERLQYLARLKKVDQSQVAEDNGWQRQVVNRWWTGKTTNIRDSNLEALAKYFHCEFDWLKHGRGPRIILTDDNIGSTPEWAYTDDGAIGGKVLMKVEHSKRQKYRQSLEQKDDTQNHYVDVKSEAGYPSPGAEKDDDVGDEMHTKLDVIILSKTVYRPAIISNIRAFHQAVLAEEEMGEIVNTMEEMKKTVEENNARMKRIEELLETQIAQPVAKGGRS